MGVDSCCVNSSFAFPDVKYCLRRIAFVMPFPPLEDKTNLYWCTAAIYTVL